MAVKRCTKCGQLKPLDEFTRAPRCKDGTENRCKMCKSEYDRQYREQNRDYIVQNRKKYSGRYKGRYKEPADIVQARKEHWFQKHPNAKKAHSMVMHAIQAGKIPPAKKLLCSHCEKQAAHYHHYLGYESPHELDVQPLCHACHRAIHNNSWHR